MDLEFSTINGSNVSTTGACFPSFNDDLRCDIIIGFRRALAILSMLCCLFVVFVIVVFKKYKVMHQRLILYLSIFSFFQAISYAMTDYHIVDKARHGELVGLCVFQAIYTLFFDWASFLWVGCITFNIFWNVVFLKKTYKFEKFYAIVCLVVPTILCCFPFIEHSYGPAGLWCWISSYRDHQVYTPGVALQFTIFYVPIWTLSLVLLIALVLVFCLNRRRAKKFGGAHNPQLQSQKKLWEEEIRPLVLFPWIYLFILIFPIMNRLRQAFGFFEPDSGWNFFFWFMHSVTLTLHGTLYACVFACDKQTMSRLTYTRIKAAIMYRWDKKVQEYPIEQFSERRETLGTTKIKTIHSDSSNDIDIKTNSYTLYSDDPKD